jgi:mannose-6-phosphate isomerase-like protein (cupin superfamily)
MASEQDDALREMAAHRGLRLVKSRRRKPGGDFGLYGLKHPKTGEPVFGMDEGGLTATAEEIETYLRNAMRADWSSSAGGARPRRRKPAPPPPPPPPPPKKKLALKNLLKRLPAARRDEAFTELLSRPGIRLERIVSRGQATPADAPMVQETDEWVLLLSGAAGLRLEGFEEVTLAPGDHLLIPAGTPHWVTWTGTDRPTVWLALHLG